MLQSTVIDRDDDVRLDGSTPRRVLFISYHFPPVGGAGVQRPVKFVKYLGQFGWQPSVLMAANPSAPVFDESLCADIPHDLLTVKARTLEPSYQVKQRLNDDQARVNAPSGFAAMKRGLRRAAGGLARAAAGVLLQPDPQVLWLPAAYRAACDLLRRVPHDAIIATAPPYSNLLLGGLLKRRFGLPLIADYRDEWDLSSRYLENARRDWVSQLVQGRIQRWVLRQSAAVISTTRASTATLAERAGRAGSRALAECIYNGFDDDDFPYFDRSARANTGGKSAFRMVYAGTLWNLTTVEPLVRGVECLAVEQAALLPRLELEFIGRKTAAQQALLERMARVGVRVIQTDYCEHAVALRRARQADALLLLLADVPGAERVVPAKLFEYFAVGKPFLAIAPAGETADLVRTLTPANYRDPRDAAGIARWLADRIQRSELGDPGTVVDGERIAAADLRSFSRRHEAGQLADLLDRVVTVAGARSVNRRVEQSEVNEFRAMAPGASL